MRTALGAPTRCARTLARSSWTSLPLSCTSTAWVEMTLLGPGAVSWMTGRVRVLRRNEAQDLVSLKIESGTFETIACVAQNVPPNVRASWCWDQAPPSTHQILGALLPRGQPVGQSAPVG